MGIAPTDIRKLRSMIVPLAQNHVSVGITISRSTKFWNFIDRLLAQSHHLHELLGVGQVGVRVASTEVLLQKRKSFI